MCLADGMDCGAVIWVGWLKSLPKAFSRFALVQLTRPPRPGGKGNIQIACSGRNSLRDIRDLILAFGEAGLAHAHTFNPPSASFLTAYLGPE